MRKTFLLYKILIHNFFYYLDKQYRRNYQLAFPCKAQMYGHAFEQLVHAFLHGPKSPFEYKGHHQELKNHFQNRMVPNNAR